MAELSTQGGYIEFQLNGSDEVECVRRAFEEHNSYLESMGNDSSISEWDRFMATCPSQYFCNRTVRAAHIMQLTDPLEHFVEVTGEVIDHLIDTRSNVTRAAAASTRRRLSLIADVLLEQLDSEDIDDRPLEYV